jgi:hypothetical protein
LGRTPCPVGEAAIYVGDSNPSTPNFAGNDRRFRVLTKSPPWLNPYRDPQRWFNP